MKLFDDPEIQSLNPKLLEPTSLHLLGCVFYGDPFHDAKEWTYENEIGALWNRFMRIYSKYRYLLDSINNDRDIGYEMHLEPSEYETTRKYYVFVGLAIKNLSEIPLEMYYKPLPQVQYLQFTTKTQDHAKSEYIFRKWLLNEESSYRQAFPYVIQMYNSRRYRGLEDPTSEIDWLIPIQERPKNDQEKIGSPKKSNNLMQKQPKGKKKAGMLDE